MSKQWTIEEGANSHFFELIVMNGEDCVAFTNDEYAHLIAAAPELLEALKLLLPVAQQFEKQASKGTGGRRGGPVFTKARAAIARATPEETS